MAEDEQSSAIVNFAKSGTYPEDEHGGLAHDLQAVSISNARQSLQQARQELESRIKSTSRHVAPDVDGWIKRAKQLQADIEQSRNVARGVIEESERARATHEKSLDAASKADLLKVETKYYSGLRDTLQEVKSARDGLNRTREAVSQGHVLEALTSLQKLESVVSTIGDVGSTNAFDLIRQRAEDLRRNVVEQAQELMRKAIHVDRTARELSIRKHVLTTTGRQIDVKEVIELSASLGVLREDLTRITSDIEHSITGPILANGEFTAKMSLAQISKETLQVSSSGDLDSKSDLVGDLVKTLKFLKDELPSSANDILVGMLLPPIIAYLTSQKLPAALPISIQDSGFLGDIIHQVHQLALTLDDLSWSGALDLQECERDIPKIWLSKKREAAIDKVRSLISRSLTNRKSVEHVETQVLSSDDAMVQNHTVPIDDWNDDWKNNGMRTEETPKSNHEEDEEEEEEWGGWDAEEGKSSNAANAHVNRGQGAKPDTEGDEGADWDDWDEQKPDHTSSENNRSINNKPRSNGSTIPARSKPHKVTLRETYTTTALPDELFTVVTSIIEDAQTLRTPADSLSPLISAAPALYSIPTVCIAAFRSLAPPAYELLQGGNMLLFNDSNRLTSQLKALQSDLQASADVATSRLKLDTDITALEGFARRNYSKAMEEQRTIFRDFVDNAQGFVNCTTQPYKSACNDAISMTVAHLHSTAELWNTILSQNAWLQALGSLLSTVIGKIIVDIEEMSDIGAEESTQLRTYVTEVSKLQELFVQDGRESVGLYVREWFKFQYLAEVLDSNLEDVKFLWREGGLRNEFEVEEVVDLVEALFADSDRRRRAVSEIRHG